MKRSRPQGLKKAVNAKKQREGSTNDKEQGDIHIDAELDELDAEGQLVALYDAYEREAAQPEADLQTQNKLLSGIVHEADALVRDGNSVSAIVHKIYGLSLLELARFTLSEPKAGESERDFIEAALERLDLGLEAYAQDSDLLFARARALLALIRLKVDEGPERQDLDPDLEAFVQAFELAEKHLHSPTARTHVPQLTALDDLADLALLTQDDSLQQWVQDRWEAFVATYEVEDKSGKGKAKIDPDAHLLVSRSHQGLGALLFGQAEPIMATLFADDDDDNSNEEESEDDYYSEIRALAHSYLQKARDHLAKAESSGKLHALTAEVLLAQGNLEKNESKEQDALYEEAIVHLKRAQQLGAGDFSATIRELTK